MRAPISYKPLLYTKLRWDGTYNLSNTFGTDPYFQSICFRGNDPYKCDNGSVAGGTNSARDYDFWFDKYQNCLVLGSKITLYCIPNNGATKLCFMYLLPDQSATAGTNNYFQPTINSPHAQFKIMTTFNGRNVFFKRFDKTKRVWSRKDIIDDESFGATANSSPSSLWYWNLYWMNGDYSATAQNFTIRARITYYVCYRKLKMAPV